nr:kinesin-like protein KIF15 isoform X1 [Parasteatoda tepidariorum]XP_042901734.1 kinesin-like protein KIF15 isoform X2 [Parasteatoda tepidariorum]
MEGDVANMDKFGIIPRVAQDIFNQAESTLDSKCEIKISFYEIYLERIHDLFNDSQKRNLKVYDDKKNLPFIVGGTEICVESVSELMNHFCKAKLKRQIAATDANEVSSRSHTIFQIVVKQENIATKKKLLGKLLLVDLAGSEKAWQKDQNGSAIKRQSTYINKSLSVLTKVISLLSEGKKTVIPYRESILTRLLKESLGGNSQTAIIICVNPFSELETKLSLEFGSRAKVIQNNLHPNLKNNEDKLNRFSSNIEMYLRETVSELKRWRSGETVPIAEWTALNDGNVGDDSLLDSSLMSSPDTEVSSVFDETDDSLVLSEQQQQDPDIQPKLSEIDIEMKKMKSLNDQYMKQLAETKEELDFYIEVCTSHRRKCWVLNEVFLSDTKMFQSQEASDESNDCANSEEFEAENDSFQEDEVQFSLFGAKIADINKGIESLTSELSEQMQYLTKMRVSQEQRIDELTQEKSDTLDENECFRRAIGLLMESHAMEKQSLRAEVDKLHDEMKREKLELNKEYSRMIQIKESHDCLQSTLEDMSGALNSKEEEIKFLKRELESEKIRNVEISSKINIVLLEKTNVELLLMEKTRDLCDQSLKNMKYFSGESEIVKHDEVNANDETSFAATLLYGGMWIYNDDLTRVSYSQLNSASENHPNCTDYFDDPYLVNSMDGNYELMNINEIDGKINKDGQNIEESLKKFDLPERSEFVGDCSKLLDATTVVDDIANIKTTNKSIDVNSGEMSGKLKEISINKSPPGQEPAEQPEMKTKPTEEFDDEILFSATLLYGGMWLYNDDLTRVSYSQLNSASDNHTYCTNYFDDPCLVNSMNGNYELMNINEIDGKINKDGQNVEESLMESNLPELNEFIDDGSEFLDATTVVDDIGNIKTTNKPIEVNSGEMSGKLKEININKSPPGQEPAEQPEMKTEPTEEFDDEILFVATLLYGGMWLYNDDLTRVSYSQLNIASDNHPYCTNYFDDPCLVKYMNGNCEFYELMNVNKIDGNINKDWQNIEESLKKFDLPERSEFVGDCSKLLDATTVVNDIGNIKTTNKPIDVNSGEMSGKLKEISINKSPPGQEPAEQPEMKTEPTEEFDDEILFAATLLYGGMWLYNDDLTRVSYSQLNSASENHPNCTDYFDDPCLVNSMDGNYEFMKINEIDGKINKDWQNIEESLMKSNLPEVFIDDCSKLLDATTVVDDIGNIRTTNKPIEVNSGEMSIKLKDISINKSTRGQEPPEQPEMKMEPMAEEFDDVFRITSFSTSELCFPQRSEEDEYEARSVNNRILDIILLFICLWLCVLCYGS